MRAKALCPKCGGGKIGHLDSIPDFGDSWPPNKQAIGYTLAEKRKWTIGTERNIHEVEALVCTTCGYLEYYAKSPETIPFEEIEGFTWYKKPT